MVLNELQAVSDLLRSSLFPSYPLKVGDSVGVVVKNDGYLHFWVGGVDQGPAVQLDPASKYWGVVDMFGKTREVKILPGRMLKASCDGDGFTPRSEADEVVTTEQRVEAPLRRSDQLLLEELWNLESETDGSSESTVDLESPLVFSQFTTFHYLTFNSLRS